MAHDPKQLNPIFQADKTYPEQNNGDYVLPATVDLLPAVFRTDTNKKLLNAVMEDIFQPHSLEDLNYAVGRNTSKVNFKDYLPHATAKRQLETGLLYYRDTGAETLSADEVAQGWGLNDRATEVPVPVSVLDLPIDPDKFVNWVNYHWIDEGMPVIYVNGGAVGSTYDSFNVLNDIIGKQSFVTPVQRNGRRLELQNGMRIVLQQFRNQQDINGDGTITLQTNGESQQSILADFTAYDKTKIRITVSGDEKDNGTDFEVYGNSIFWLTTPPDSGLPMIVSSPDYYISTEADDLKAQRRWLVSGVGTSDGIQLLSRTFQYTNTTYSKAGNNLWDQTAQPWDSLEWDGINRGVNQKHYILMQPGAANRNAHSRVNVWLHKETIQAIANFLGILFADIANVRSQALRPIVEFDRNLEMYQHGIAHSAWPNCVVDNNLVADSEFVDLLLVTSGSTVLNADYIALVNKLKVDADVVVTLTNDTKIRTAINKNSLSLIEFDQSVNTNSPIVIYKIVNGTINWVYNLPADGETIHVEYRISGVILSRLRILWLAAGDNQYHIINVVTDSTHTRRLLTVLPSNGDAVTIDIPDPTSKYYLREYYWKGGSALPAQTRLTFNQQPLFELYDADHKKLSDNTNTPQITNSKIIDIVKGTVYDSESGYKLSFLPSQFTAMTDGNPAKNAMYDIMYNHTQQTPSLTIEASAVVRGPYNFRRFNNPLNTAGELSNGYQKAWFRLKSAVIKTLLVDNSQISFDASAWPTYEWTIAPKDGIARVLHNDNLEVVVNSVAVVARGEPVTFKLASPDYSIVIDDEVLTADITNTVSFIVSKDAPTTMTLVLSDSARITMRVINVEQDPRAPQVLLNGLPTEYSFIIPRDANGYATSITVNVQGKGIAEVRHQGNQINPKDSITAVPGLDFNPLQDINFGEFTPSRIINAFHKNIKINEQAASIAGHVVLTLTNFTDGDLVKFIAGNLGEQTFTITTQTTVADIATDINAVGTLHGVVATVVDGKLILTSTNVLNKDVTGTFTNTLSALVTAGEATASVNTAWVNSTQWLAMDGAIMTDYSSMRSAWASFRLAPTIQDSIISRSSSAWNWYRKFTSRLDYFYQTHDLNAISIREALDLILEDTLIGVTYSSPDAVSGMALTTKAMSSASHVGDGSTRSFTINTGSSTLYTDIYGPDHVYVYVDDVLESRNNYSILSTGSINFINAPSNDKSIVIYHASEMSIYSGIPAGPAKLGLSGLVHPDFETDTWGPQTKTFIRRHDNSRTTVYVDNNGNHINDIRNKIILELELRIYNACLNGVGTRNRQRQFNNFDSKAPSESLGRAMIEWFAEHNVDYQGNSYYDPDDSWTWNYGGMSWEGLYVAKFGTTQLHSRPWEALGFDTAPTWWDNHYSWIVVNERVALEYALTNGIITEPNTPVTIDLAVARPVINSYPVDVLGELVSPADWEEVPTSSADDADAPWTIGSWGLPELVWRRSVAGAWAGVLYSIDNYNIFNKFFDTSINPFIVTIPTNSPMQQGYSSMATSGFQQNRPTIGIGAALFEANREFNLLGETPLHELIGLSPRLQFGIGGFTDNAMTLKMYYTKYQTGSYVPLEDFFVNLSSGVPTDILRYSSVRVEKSGLGFRVYGFDPGHRYFTIYTPTALESGIRYAADRRIVSTSTGDLIQYLKWGNSKVNIAYGEYISTTQELFTFFQGLQEYQASHGLVLDTISSRNTVTDWIQAALDAIHWIGENWGTSHYCIVGVATADGLKIKHTRGILERLDSDLGRAGKIIFDDGYSAISSDIQIIRDYELDIDKIMSISGKQIVFAELQSQDYQHIVYVNPKTKFGDLLADFQTGNRIDALQLAARRTQQWTGRPHAPGVLVQKTNLLPGFDALVSDIINSHKVELNGFDTFKAKVGRSAVIPAKYTVINELIQDYNTATLYRQGVQSSAGTTLSIEALFRNIEIDIPGRVQDVTLSESWLFETGKFGNLVNDKFWEFELRVEDIVSQKQIIRFSDATVGLRSDNIIDITKNDKRWVSKPADPYIFATLDRSTQTNVDQIESWMPNAGVAKLFDADIQKRDLNSLTMADFLRIDQASAASSIGQTYTGTLTTAQLFRVTGFSRYTDYQPGDMAWNSGILYIAKEKIVGSATGEFDSSQWTENTDVASVLPSIWVSDYGFELSEGTHHDRGYGWNMLQVFAPMYVEESCPNALNTGLNESRVTFPVPHGLKEGEFFILSGGNDGNYDAVHKVKAVADDFNILIAARSISDQIVYNMVAFKMLPIKFNTIERFNDSKVPPLSYNWQPGMKAYIDNEGSGQHYNQIFTVINVEAGVDEEDIIVPSLPTIIDTAALYNAELVDYDTGNVIASLEIYDPFKGITIDQAAQYINYKVPVDPAVYNIDELGLQDLYVSAPWGRLAVGKLWWDLNAVRYIEYEQGTLDYRAENWGKQFTDSEVAIYEWTSNTTLPDETVLNIKLEYSSGVGQIRYSLINEINSITGGFTPTYYYWIRHPDTLPMAATRTKSALAIESILNDPDANGVAWLAAIDTSATSASILLSNFTSFLATRDKVILRIEQISKPEQRHSTSELVTEGKTGTIIPDNLYNRMRDSLVSYNETKVIKPIKVFAVNESYKSGDIISYYDATGIDFTQPLQYGKFDIPFLPTINSTRQDVINVWVSPTVADSKFGLFVVIAPFTNAGSWESITHKLSKFVAPITQVLDQFIDTRFYAVIDKSQRVPDMKLHVKRRYGNNIVPSPQSWFNDLSSARRTFITALNTYLLKIDTVSKTDWDKYLRVVQGTTGSSKLHIDPDYDRETGVENVDYAIVNGVKSYYHIPIWDYVDYNTKSTGPGNEYVKLSGFQDLTLEQNMGLTEFAIVDGNGVITEVYAQDITGNLQLNYRKNGTIQFRTLWEELAWDTHIWGQVAWDLGYDTMFSVILKSIRNNIFTNVDIGYFNLIFFDMVKESLAQEPADWVIKTTYVNVEHSSLNDLRPIAIFYDKKDELISAYINEVKPYHSKVINEGIFSKSTVDLPVNLSETIVLTTTETTYIVTESADIIPLDRRRDGLHTVPFTQYIRITTELGQPIMTEINIGEHVTVDEL